MGTPRSSKSSTLSRETITFRAYYWEAYNEIVQPRAIGRYLIRRWLPDLGTNGYAIVQVLRDRAYFNAETGELRNDIFVESMSELARTCGMSESTLRREFSRNAALAEFVRKAPAYQPNRRASLFGRNVEKAGTVYWIAMDDPIHPFDEARYQQLKQQKELERGERKMGASGIPSSVLLAMRGAPSPFGHDEAAADPGGDPEQGAGASYTGQSDRYRGDGERNAYTSQNDRYRGVAASGSQNDGGAGQNDGPVRQNDRDQRQNDRYINKVDPSSSSLFNPSDTATLSPKPHGLPPEGVQSEETEPLWVSAWKAALPRIATRVNKPTFETHIRTLVPVSLSNAPEPLPEAPSPSAARMFMLYVASPFTRDWLEKRYVTVLNAVLSEVMGEPVSVYLTLKTDQAS